MMVKAQKISEDRIERLIELDFYRILGLAKDKYALSIPSLPDYTRLDSKFDLALIDPRVDIDQLGERVEEAGCRRGSFVDLREACDTFNLSNTPYWIPVRTDQLVRERNVSKVREKCPTGLRGLTLKEGIHCFLEGVEGFSGDEDWNHLLIGTSYPMTDHPYANSLVESHKYSRMKTHDYFKNISDVKWNGAPSLSYKSKNSPEVVFRNSLFVGWAWFSSDLTPRETFRQHTLPLTKKQE